jgi:anti-sigma-K factor RskA
MTTPPTSPSESLLPPVRASRWWRALAYVLLLALMLGVATTVSLYEQLKAQIGHLQARVAQAPQVRFIAVLLDDQQRPAMLVTMDPQAGALQLQRLNDVAEGREDSMQLWALVPDRPPRSLGVVTSKYKTMQINAPASALSDATELAISVEDKGGVSEMQGPRLPWLFKGWLVQKAI